LRSRATEGRAIRLPQSPYTFLKLGQLLIEQKSGADSQGKTLATAP
jgi:hypothetical protein